MQYCVVAEHVVDPQTMVVDPLDPPELVVVPLEAPELVVVPELVEVTPEDVVDETPELVDVEVDVLLDVRPLDDAPLEPVCTLDC